MRCFNIVWRTCLVQEDLSEPLMMARTVSSTSNFHSNSIQTLITTKTVNTCSVLFPPSLLHSQWNENLFFSYLSLKLCCWDCRDWKKSMKVMLKNIPVRLVVHYIPNLLKPYKSVLQETDQKYKLFFTETQFCHYLFHQCTF